MAGVYFALGTDPETGENVTELTGYLRCGGHPSVLGIVSVSVEFYLELAYKSERNELRGQATLRVKVRVAFFRKTVKLTLERTFAGPSRRPTGASLRDGGLAAAAEAGTSFGDAMTEADWRAYAEAFA